MNMKKTYNHKYNNNHKNNKFVILKYLIILFTSKKFKLNNKNLILFKFLY